MASTTIVGGARSDTVPNASGWESLTLASDHKTGPMDVGSIDPARPKRVRRPRADLRLSHDADPIAARWAQRPGLSGRAYTFVKGIMLDGVYPPEGLIPIDEIAGQIGVSRQPVLDALKRLEADGFVMIIPQVGCYTRAYPPQEVQEFYRLFAAGESIICELAAERATRQDLEQMRSASKRIGQLRKRRSDRTAVGREYRRMNRELHLLIRIAARSDCTTEIVERMGDKSDFFIAASGATLFAERLSSAHDEHEAIIQAIAERDAKTAGEVMSGHILAIAHRIKVQSASGQRGPIGHPAR